MVIKKQDLIEHILAELNRQYNTLCQAARAAYDGAIHEESKAEDKYDTRGLEASYLAGAQAKRTVELEGAISLYRSLKTRDFGAEEPIALTALIELEAEGQEALYFIGPEGGGIKIQHEGKTIIVITPKSPLGKSLLGKAADDDVEIRSGKSLRHYSILSVS
jgi:hypothetical protein